MRESTASITWESGLGSPEAEERLINSLENGILCAKAWKWENPRPVPGRGGRLLTWGDMVGHKPGKMGQNPD